MAKKTPPREANTTSPDLRAERLAELRRLLPDLFNSEGGLDSKGLNALCHPDMLAEGDKVGFQWVGREGAKLQALAPSRATLIADKNRSVDFESTENLIIEGDNLEVLKLLQTTYVDRIKCIYIDPPYNTGNDFIYPDNYAEDKAAYWQKQGIVENGVKMVALTESDGRKHSQWLNMMQSRLLLARRLLRPDGAIVVHIDENECHRLRLLLDQVFDARNFLGEIVWDKRNPKGNSTGVSYQHESILVFAKNLDSFKESSSLEVPKKNAERILRKAATLYKSVGKMKIPKKVQDALDVLGMPKTRAHEEMYSLEDANADFREWLASQRKLSAGEEMYKFIDENGRVYRGVSMASPNGDSEANGNTEPLVHPETKKQCPVPDNGWRYTAARMKEMCKEGLIIFGPDETTQPESKYFLGETMSENLASVLYHGGSDVKRLKGMGIFFENSKPVDVAVRLMYGFLAKGDMVMDFFAGSGTAGHAAMQLNAESGRGVRFMLVQVPEAIGKKHAAHKAGYKTISDLCIARVKKAGEMIKSEQTKFPVDAGFRVYCLAESIFSHNRFTPDPSKSKEENVNLLQAHIKASNQGDLFQKKDQREVIAELSLKNGYGLFFHLEQVKKGFAGNVVHRLSGNGKSTMICLDSQLKSETVKTLVQQHAPGQLIVSRRALDTGITRALQNAFGDNLLTV